MFKCQSPNSRRSDAEGTLADGPNDGRCPESRWRSNSLPRSLNRFVRHGAVNQYGCQANESAPPSPLPSGKFTLLTGHNAAVRKL